MNGYGFWHDFAEFLSMVIMGGVTVIVVGGGLWLLGMILRLVLP